MPNFLNTLRHHASSKSMDRPESRSSTRSTALSTDTMLQDSQASATGRSPAPNGEPLVEDFQTRYLAAKPIPVSRFASPGSATGASSITDTSSTRGSIAELPGSPAFTEDTDSDEAPPPPDFSRRTNNLDYASSMNEPVPYRIGDSHSFKTSSSIPASGSRYSDSMFSQETSATNVTLPPLQTKGASDEADHLDPLSEDDPANFDLVAAPAEETTGIYELEKRAEQLLSKAHLEMIFSESKWLLKFTSFLNNHRPQSIAILIFYLDALKALRAIKYANAIAEALEPISGLDFTKQAAQAPPHTALQEKADQAFEVLVREDLAAYIAYTWIQVVSATIRKRVTGTLAPHLRDASEGLAEVFCLSDPSRRDNPIVFASEEFHRTTQYGMSYSIGRNCRFLQGPRTNPHSVRRLAEACRAAKEHSEVFLNYRRDGSPFMNLLMIAPLYDSKGTLRYFIGAQVDVSGLVREATDLEALSRLIARAEDPQLAAEQDLENEKNEFQSLSEMFNVTELDTVKHCGGRMHRDQVDTSDTESVMSHRPRLLLNDSMGAVPTQAGTARPQDPIVASSHLNGRLEGVYQHYLLVRPAPSLRILFTSPSLRVPGILQSPFMSRIGGSARVRGDLSQALTEGRGVTAKIRWLTRADDDGDGEGRTRWIHCTPLIGHNGSVGVWMIVLVDEEGVAAGDGKRRFRAAPPIANKIGGKEYDGQATKERRSDRERTRVERLVPNAYEPHRGGSDAAKERYAAYTSGPATQKPPPQHLAAQERERPRSTSSSVQPSEFSFQLK